MLKRVIYVLLVLSFAATPLYAEEKESVYYKKERAKMIDYLKAAGITNKPLLEAMNDIPRQEFMPDPKKAYKERPFKIGTWAVAASPFVTAMRLNALGLKPGEKVLEVGTETGYEAAVMARIGAIVYSIELVPELGEAAIKRIEQLGYKNINIRVGDGFDGWEEEAPFDAMVFAPAPDDFPPRLVEQLKEGGRMVLSLGKLYGPQTLVYAYKENGVMKTRPLADIKSPPMRGKILE